jgi:Ca2+-binding EF-hand superfamily protein
MVEFTNLPGILSDRLCAVMGASGGSDSKITREKFLDTMSQIYNSRLEEKIRLVFQIFDFNADGKISAEDVKVILSFLPIR